MSADILILRPQPGADRTAARVRALGLVPVVAPIFTISALPWRPPAARFDAVMLTSANAARHGGDALTPFLSTPCHAVGETTAEAAREAGFLNVVTGPADSAALAADMVAAGVRTAFWPCGADRRTPDHPLLRIMATPVYVSEPVEFLPPEAESALREGAIALLHSARAGVLFGTLAARARANIRIAAISSAVADAAGDGWAAVEIADRPRDDALLELAAKLCQTGRAMRRPQA